MGKTARTASPALEVEVVPIASLTLDPRNARKHGRRNLDAIRGSLEQFGQRRPLVVRADLQIIAGKGTLVAMRDLAMKKVAVTRVPADWSDEQVRAYALADNRTAELAEWDDVVLADMLAELDAGESELRNLLIGALGLAFARLEEGGACYVFHGDSKRATFERAMHDVGYLVHQTLVWVKDAFVLARLDYQPQHEPILLVPGVAVMREQVSTRPLLSSGPYGHPFSMHQRASAFGSSRRWHGYPDGL